jgi:hypothetical protein
MGILTTRRKSKKQRAVSAVGKAGTVARKYVKAKIAWIAARKATKIAAPAVAVGTAAVVAKKRSGKAAAV